MNVRSSFRFVSALLVALSVSSLALKPAYAFDPYLVGSALSALLPTREYVTKGSRSGAQTFWFVNGRLKGVWDESSRTACFIPNYGNSVHPVHFPNIGGKGISQAWMTENAIVDLRQDKPESKRANKRDTRRKHGTSCVCEECVAPETQRGYVPMVCKGKLWHFGLNLNSSTVGLRTFRTAYEVEGGKEVTTRGPLGIGKKASYKDIEEEGYVTVTVINILDDEGNLLPEFCDRNSEDGVNYRAIFAACPGLQPVDARDRLPRASRPQPLIQRLDGNGQPNDQDQSATTEEQADEETQTETSPDLGANVKRNMSDATPPSPQITTDSTGSRRWVKIVNERKVDVEFAVQAKSGANSTQPTKLKPGEEKEIELPADADNSFTIFFREMAGSDAGQAKRKAPEFKPLRNRVDGGFTFPSPVVDKGIRVVI